MLLTKVILKNYGVFRDEKVFDFTCSEDKPIILFGGTNGAGKTTLFESIILCLYGMSFFEKKISKKEYEKYLSRKIHRFLGTPVSAEFASITVEFQFFHQGKVDLYSVNRMWSNDDGQINEKLIISKNDKPLDSVEESQWQSFIEELIPRGISKLFFFDGEKITKMAEEETEDVEIKSSFDALLGLDLVEQVQSDLRVHNLRIMSGNSKEIQEKLDNLSKEKEGSNQKIELLMEKLSSLRTEADSITKTIDNLEARISKLGGGYATQRDKLKEKKAYLEMNLAVIENNIKNLCAGSLPFCIIPNELKQVEEQLEADQELLKKQFEREILDKNFGQIKSDISSAKFWSDFKLDSAVKTKITSQIFEMFEEKINSKQYDGGHGVLNFSTLETSNLLNMVDKIKNELPKELEKETIEFSKITDELQKIETALANAPKDDEIGPLISELNSHYENLGTLKAEIDHIEQKIGQEHALIKVINYKIKTTLSEKYTDKNASVQAELAEKVQTVLTEYANKLKIKKLQLLEKYLLEAIQTLMHKADFIDKISINKETFAITLYRKDENEIPKDLLSKGEKQMFATAVLWALAKTSGKPLPFIIDTPLARLDLEHRSNLVEKFFPIASHQVVIFSTDSEIDEKYYPKIKPYVSRSYAMEYLPGKGNTRLYNGYFWNNKGEKIIAV
jgi:DNA sulfur modification protein DndD